MEVQFSNYNTSTIRLLTLPENGLLLNTGDVCSALGITNRPAGSVLSTPCMDLASAVNVAGAKNSDFALWLNETFASYNPEQLVHPQCDDDWNLNDFGVNSELESCSSNINYGDVPPTLFPGDMGKTIPHDKNTETMIDRYVTLAINALQLLGFFEQAPNISGWHLRWDGKKLAQLGYKAAATASGKYPVMVLSEDFSLSLENDIAALIHEFIHMAQIIKGEMVPGYGDGTTIWKCKKYYNLPAEHARYFEQPWEAEANEWFPLVASKMAELDNRDALK